MDENILFAHFAISKNLLTEEQIRQGIGELQKASHNDLASICVKNKWITSGVVAKVNQEIQKNLETQNKDLEKSVNQLKVRVTTAMKTMNKTSSKSEILRKVASVQNKDTQVIRKNDIAMPTGLTNDISQKVKEIEQHSTLDMSPIDMGEDIIVKNPTQHMRNVKSEIPISEKQQNLKSDRTPSEIMKKVKAVQNQPTQIMKKPDISKDFINSDVLIEKNTPSFSLDSADILQKNSKKPLVNKAKKKKKFFLNFDNYEIQDEIARGGMGIVYKAEQKDNGQIVAIKIMKKFDITNPKYVARFHREIQAAGKLNHPNIVGIYHAGEIEGTPYFAMEYIKGLTLSDYAKKKKPNTAKIVSIMKKIALAIDHAHKHHIIHRDLKPANIIIDNNDEPHITDFGLAKDTSMSIDLTQSGIILGTPYYMSPEQAVANKDQVGKGSDIFSIGVMLYELLTQKLPFTADDVSKLYQKISHHRPTKLRKINKHIHASLELIVEKSLAKKPARRYKSGKSLAEDLDRYENDAPVNAKPPSIIHVISDEIEKHLFLLLGMLFVFLLICAFYVIVLWKP